MAIYNLLEKGSICQIEPSSFMTNISNLTKKIALDVYIRIYIYDIEIKAG